MGWSSKQMALRKLQGCQTCTETKPILELRLSELRHLLRPWRSLEHKKWSPMVVVEPAHLKITKIFEIAIFCGGYSPENERISPENRWLEDAFPIKMVPFPIAKPFNVRWWYSWCLKCEMNIHWRLEFIVINPPFKRVVWHIQGFMWYNPFDVQPSTVWSRHLFLFRSGWKITLHESESERIFYWCKSTKNHQETFHGTNIFSHIFTHLHIFLYRSNIALLWFGTFRYFNSKHCFSNLVICPFNNLLVQLDKHESHHSPQRQKEHQRLQVRCQNSITFQKNSDTKCTFQPRDVGCCLTNSKNLWLVLCQKQQIWSVSSWSKQNKIKNMSISMRKFFSTNNRPQRNRQTICNNGDPPANVQPYRGFCRKNSHQKDFGTKSLGVSQKSKAIKCVGSVKVDPFSIGIIMEIPNFGPTIHQMWPT